MTDLLTAATIPALVSLRARELGTEEAIVDGDLRLSFADVDRRMREVAAAIAAAGAQRGDRIAVWAPNSAAWITAALGVMAAGGVVVPISLRYRGDEAADIIERSSARLVITSGAFVGLDYAASSHMRVPISPTSRSCCWTEPRRPNARCRGTNSSAPARQCRRVSSTHASHPCLRTIPPTCSTRLGRRAAEGRGPVPREQSLVRGEPSALVGGGPRRPQLRDSALLPHLRTQRRLPDRHVRRGDDRHCEPLRRGANAAHAAKRADHMPAWPADDLSSDSRPPAPRRVRPLRTQGRIPRIDRPAGIARRGSSSITGSRRPSRPATV